MATKTQDTINALANGIINYINVMVSNAPFVLTDLGKVKSVTLTNGKYLHTVTIRNFDYVGIKSMGNNEFPVGSVVYILVPNRQYNQMFILGHCDDTNANIKGGNINLGNGNFTVDNNGYMTAKKGYIGNGSTGFTIDSNAIYNGVTTLGDNTHEGAYFGTAGIRISGENIYGSSIQKGDFIVSNSQNSVFMTNMGISVKAYDDAFGNILIRRYSQNLLGDGFLEAENSCYIATNNGTPVSYNSRVNVSEYVKTSPTTWSSKANSEISLKGIFTYGEWTNNYDNKIIDSHINFNNNYNTKFNKSSDTFLNTIDARFTKKNSNNVSLEDNSFIVNLDIGYISFSKIINGTGKTITFSNNGSTTNIDIDNINSYNYNKCLLQTNTTSSGNYRVLYGENLNDNTETAGARKGGLFYNPSLHRLYIGGSATGAMFEYPSSQTLYLRASNEGDYGINIGVMDSMWALAPIVNNKMALGSPSYKWKQIYAVSGTINTSDRNEKKDIEILNDELSERFLMSLNPVSYKLINGESGRTHYGFIAQDVEDTLNSLNLTAMDFAGFCKDQKTRDVETVRYTEDGYEIIDEYGNVETNIHQEPIPNEYSYGLRYEEFIPLCVKMIQMQQLRIEELERKVSNGNQNYKL